jgi:hypothetical protein
MSRKKQIAYHEAAHAVIGRVLTLPCGRATIKPDHDSAGHSFCPDPYFCIYEWEKLLWLVVFNDDGEYVVLLPASALAYARLESRAMHTLSGRQAR